MEQFFTIRQAATAAHMTSETLRHYDRIGLVKPCKKDASSGYRYYSQKEIIRLKTIELLKCMELSLAEIKTVLEYNDLPKVIALLKQAEQNAEQKIAQLKFAKKRIRRAYSDYEKKLSDHTAQSNVPYLAHFPARAILISQNLELPTLENLLDYHRHFYKQVGSAQKGQFEFEDRAGVIFYQGKHRLFAVCSKFPEQYPLTLLLEGEYLCSNCAEEQREAVSEKLLTQAKKEYGISAPFVIQSIVVSGILNWSYQIQIPLGSTAFKQKNTVLHTSEA